MDGDVHVGVADAHIKAQMKFSVGSGMNSRLDGFVQHAPKLLERGLQFQSGIRDRNASDISQMPNLAPFAPFCGHSNSRFCSGQRLSAVLDALGHFGHGIGAFRDFVFQFDLGGEGPLFLPHQLEHFPDRRLTLAPRQVGPVGGPVLQMQAHDAVVILLDHGNRRQAFRAGHVMADVEIEADERPDLEMSRMGKQSFTP